jgi:hypothetical protein
MSKLFKKAARQFLVALAIEAGDRIGKAVGKRVARAIEGRRRRKRGKKK